MIKTRLFTRDGGYVVTVLVPQFQPKAEAIVWGSRIFFLKDDGEYREGIAYYVW
jgi:hypothetical protein